MRYTCDYCGDKVPIGLVCCDAVSLDVDTDLDGSTIERGID